MAAIETLAVFPGGGGAGDRLIGAWAGRFFDLSRQYEEGDVRRTRIPPPDGFPTLFTSSRWHFDTITNSAGTVFLVLANGSDPPVRYSTQVDNAGLHSAQVSLHSSYQRETEDPQFGDFDAGRMAGCLHFKNRLWWWERGRRRLWFGEIQSPGGQLTPFPIAAAARDLGEVVSLGSISRDGGDGPDDYLVILFLSLIHI